MTRPLILITNDDGIASPGLAAIAAVLDNLGDLLIVAPRTQQSSSGRSMPNSSDGRIFKYDVQANDKTWVGYGVHASPAQAVQHALLELADRKPALAVSGINYGENIGFSITISGTIGAALEAVSHGIPALAVSLQVTQDKHHTNDASVDFSTAAHFTRLFAQKMLAQTMPPDVDILKVEVPMTATPQTAWRVTRLERGRYYEPLPPQREHLEDEGRMGYRLQNAKPSSPDTDAAAMREGIISVTPISMDMTSRIKLEDFTELLG
jgi:5'-nucleotidase